MQAVPLSPQPSAVSAAPQASDIALAAATPASAFVTESQFNAGLSALGSSLRQLIGVIQAVSEDRKVSYSLVVDDWWER